MSSNKFVDAAVSYALEQVGKGYEWGSVGPDTFDCSGLTLQAWEAGQVSLPHNSREQAKQVAHPRRHHLPIQLGDLVFYYQPITHVAIIVGKRLGSWQVVQASNEVLGVNRAPIDAYATPTGFGRPYYPGLILH